MSKEPSKTYDFGAELDDVDISQLVSTTPTNEGDKAPPAEQVRQVAEKAGYTSREAKSLKSKKNPVRKRRVYRTGRNEQFNDRVRPAVIEGYHQIAEKKNWVMGETLERALAALQRELQGAGSQTSAE